MDDRTCGWTEEDLFLWFDGDLTAAQATRFERHLPGCSACSRERVAYERLFARLAGLPVPVVAPTFDDAILRSWGRPARFEYPNNGWLRGALLAAASFILLAVGALMLIDERAMVNKAAQPVAHLGAKATVDAALQILGAVDLSEVTIDIVHALEPVGRSALVVARAFQSEFLLVSLLLSLVALLGAIRLADGTSAVERGVRRVCLALQI